MQETAIPAIQEHANTVLLSPTGSGKTLAFLLPVLTLMKENKPGVQCLILSPTRELAIQIERVWQKMGTGFKVNTCYGGHPMQTEVQNLSQPPALLIGTPGRILEHVTRQTFAVDSVATLVLDEFDKCLSMGFQEQMGDIIKVLRNLEKRVLVSATNKQQIPAFTGITNPKVLNFYNAPEQTTDGLQLRRVVASGHDKASALFQLLCQLGNEQTLIFCNQRDTTEATREFLESMGIACDHFHGGMEQKDREKTLVKFRNGTTVFLVTSDLAARGLDIPEVKNVVHYELPNKLNDFTHRNGRTARMHAEGIAYLIMGEKTELPAYLAAEPELFELSEAINLPEDSPWVTVYISGGKKDKISKADIVGFFTQKGNIPGEDIGKIEVLDFMSFAAVKKSVAIRMTKKLGNEKMKGKKYRLAIT